MLRVGRLHSTDRLQLYRAFCQSQSTPHHYGHHRGRSMLSGDFSPIVLSEEIRDALLKGLPVVALESTIISHGMPYPRNLEVAKDVERIVRSAGALPATIAIIDGVPRVGLSEADLMKLANNHNTNSVVKASTRDLSYACVRKLTAATTVASTMTIAHRVGISVFATGGIGGVHRGAEVTMDVSADLLELSRTPVTVVCAGIKSILDIPKSLEVLESLSVPVMTYSSPVFPAFYTNDSGCASPLVASSCEEVASMMATQRSLDLSAGLLIAVPNPHPASMEKTRYAVDFALLSAANEGITGAAVTPYVLDRVQRLTDGESLEANIALIQHNALLAARIAIAYAELVHNQRLDAGTSTNDRPAVHTVTSASTPLHDKMSATVVVVDDGPHSEEPLSITQDDESTPPAADCILVVGASMIDLIGTLSVSTQLKSSNPGRVQASNGGVGRNIAQSLAALGVRVKLGSVVADDSNGRKLLEDCRSAGIDTSLIKIMSSNDDDDHHHQHRTAVYNAIHDESGDLLVGVADTAIMHQLDGLYADALADDLRAIRVLVLDGNLSIEAFTSLVSTACRHGVTVFFEPTSSHKCLLPLLAGCFHQIDIIKPNVHELIKMTHHCLSCNLLNSGRALVSNVISNLVASRMDASSQEVDLTDVRILATALHQVMSSSSSLGDSGGLSESKLVKGKHILVTMGSRGVLWCGPLDALNAATATQQTNGPLGAAVVVDESGRTATYYVPAVVIDPKDVINTNGAGDAFCSGVLSKMMQLHRIRSEDNSSRGGNSSLPNLECIRAGLLNAHHRIITNSDC